MMNLTLNVRAEYRTNGTTYHTECVIPHDGVAFNTDFSTPREIAAAAIYTAMKNGLRQPRLSLHIEGDRNGLRSELTTLLADPKLVSDAQRRLEDERQRKLPW